ncbi:unnamed protein product [Polarella glacialis]|uniref:Uncharacterized protein n=1 Tax=Polarella glacialis TaxID=89957 RepID=A0A813F580_POLGL|nr:unnamed protein product [Polarella glacialis]
MTSACSDGIGGLMRSAGRVGGVAACCLLASLSLVPRAEASLCVPHALLEYLVLETRRTIISQALPAELQVTKATRSLEELDYAFGATRTQSVMIRCALLLAGPPARSWGEEERPWFMRMGLAFTATPSRCPWPEWP